MTGLTLLKNSLTKLGKKIATSTGLSITVQGLLKAAVALTGRNVASSGTSTTTVLGLLTAAAALSGKRVAADSAVTVTAQALLEEALTLIGADPTDTTDYEAAAIVHINKMLADLFAINNGIMEIHGDTPNADIQSIDAMTDTIPCNAELVKNVMLYGLARDIGLQDQIDNESYFAQSYDVNKASYAIGGTTDVTAMILSSVNRMLSELFEINNSILAATGGSVLTAIPLVDAMADVVSYQDVIVNGTMISGLARDLCQNDPVKAKSFSDAYDRQRADNMICSSGDATAVAIASINKMLADLFRINNDARVVSGSAVLSSIPTVSALSGTLTYQDDIVQSVMVAGLARDLCAGISEEQVKRFAGQYDAEKAEYTISTTGDIAITAISSINEALADLFDVNNAIITSKEGTVLTDIPVIDALSDAIDYENKIVYTAMPYALARDIAASEGRKDATYFATMYDSNKTKCDVATSSSIVDEYADTEV